MNDESAPHQPESLAAQYNRELLEAKTEALKVLADLLRTSQDPAEARKIARAILSVKPIAPPRPKPEPAPALAPQPAPVSPHALGTLYLEAAALPIADPAAAPSETANPLALPITLTATNEPPQLGGPAGLNPLPHPLGAPRA